jgi:hypothetical protein
MKTALNPSVRELPFTDDEILDLVAAGKDIISAANRREYTDFKKQVSIIEGAEWSKNYPAIPISEYTLSMARTEKRIKHLGKCPEYAVLGHDSAGHRFRKDIYCGLEWCPICGQKDSSSHNRRFASWLPKVQQLKTVGYFVIEFPLKDRERFHSKTKLETAGKIITSVLKGETEIEQRRKLNHEILRSPDLVKIRRRWFSLGLRRWHFFGDPPKSVSESIERLAGVKQLPLSDDFVKMTYNPHVNVLVNAGFIPEKKLDYIKAMLRAALSCPDLIVNYSFADSPGHIVDLVKYVTRATFLNIHWDEFLAGNLYGFRNMRSWGKWEIERVNQSTGEIISPAAWSLTDLKSEAKKEIGDLDIASIHSLGESRCPIDGLLISWTKPELIRALCPEDILVDYGAGYYRLQDLPVFADKPRFETRPMYLTRQLNLTLAEFKACASFEACQDDPLRTVPGPDPRRSAAGDHQPGDCTDIVVEEGEKSMNHCVCCKVPLHHPKHALIAGGVIVYYCGKAECLQQMIEANNKLNNSGNESYKAVIYENCN